MSDIVGSLFPSVGSVGGSVVSWSGCRIDGLDGLAPFVKSLPPLGRFGLLECAAKSIFRVTVASSILTVPLRDGDEKCSK